MDKTPKTVTASRADLRQNIIDKMKTLVLPKKVERNTRPTIEELEKILNSENPGKMQINPDGSVTEYHPQTTTIEKVADAILELWDEYLTDLSEHHEEIGAFQDG